jgi:hypothetical protein
MTAYDAFLGFNDVFLPSMDIIPDEILGVPPLPSELYGGSDDVSTHGSTVETAESDLGFTQEVPMSPVEMAAMPRVPVSIYQVDFDAVTYPRDVPHALAPKPKRKKESLAHMSEEQKLNRRRAKNRDAAAKSRANKLSKLSVLEDEVQNQASLNNLLTAELDALRIENARLKAEAESLRSDKDTLRFALQSMSMKGAVRHSPY